jgi:hypothetical protein
VKVWSTAGTSPPYKVTEALLSFSKANVSLLKGAVYEIYRKTGISDKEQSVLLQTACVDLRTVSLRAVFQYNVDMADCGVPILLCGLHRLQDNKR